MLWRFRKLTCDLEKFSQIASVQLGRLRKIERKVNLKQIHPFLRDYPRQSILPQKKLNSWENSGYYLALDTEENMNNLFKCKCRTKDKMEIEHVTKKEACITGMKMRR